MRSLKSGHKRKEGTMVPTAKTAQQMLEEIRAIADGNHDEALSQVRELFAEEDRKKAEAAARRRAERRRKDHERYLKSLVYDPEDAWGLDSRSFSFRFRGELSYEDYLELAQSGIDPKVMIRFVRPSDVAENLAELLADGQVGADAIVNRLIEHYGDSGIPEETVSLLLPRVHNQRKLLANRRIVMTREQLQRVIDQEARPSIDDFIFAAIAAYEACSAGDAIPDEFEQRWHDDYECDLCSSPEDDEFGGLYWPTTDDVC